MNCTSTIFKISFSKFVAVLYSIWDISDSVDKLGMNLNSREFRMLNSKSFLIDVVAVAA